MCCGLDLGELEWRGNQPFAGRRRICAGTNQRDDLVDHVGGPDEPLDDVGPCLCLGQTMLGASGDDLLLVVDPGDERVPQRHRAGHTVVEGDHVHRERVLQWRSLVELVQDHQRGCVLLELEHQSGLALGGLVANRPDALDLATIDQLGRLLLDGFDRRLVRDLGDDDQRVLAVLDDLGLGAHLDGAATGRVRVVDPLAAQDLPTRGEVGALDEVHQGHVVGVGVGQQERGSVRDLTQVVGRNVGGHADRDALTAVHQQVREAGGEDLGLLVGGIEVVLEVDGVLVDAGEHVHGQLGEPALGVAHGGRRVRGRAEVAVRVDQWMSQRERLAEAHEGVVDGGVAVRVVLAHHLAHHGGALHV